MTRKNRRILIFGRPGSGKTTLSVLEMIEGLKQGDYVYSNIKINWFGELYLLSFYDKIFNKLYSFFMNLQKKKRRENLKKLYNEKYKLQDIQERTKLDEHEIPSVNLTQIYYSLYWIDKKIEKLKDIEIKIAEGYHQPRYYPPTRYKYFENLDEAVKDLIQKSQEDREAFFILAWDEGFTELDYRKKIPEYITNFFNQSRKLNVDIIISSQRPVAVYPSYRAICDYMILVEKGWFNAFKAKKYYVDDNANALPKTSKDIEGHERGEYYTHFNGKDVYPYFDTRQAIALKSLVDNLRKKIYNKGSI